MLDFAVDLCEGFFAGHGQDGVTQRDEDGDDSKHLRQGTMSEPAKSVRREAEIARMRQRRQRRMSNENGVHAPNDQNDHHDGDQFHDVESFFAGLLDSFGVLPPEINSGDDGKCSGDRADVCGRERTA